jgi:ElaB/YqjD/DUF883 family membrane-anchored ribosome-binding protein
MAKRRSKQVKQTVADSASGLQNVIDSAQELLENLRDQQGAAVDRVREKISETIKNAQSRLGELDVPEIAADAIDSTVGFLRSDPWRTVAIGALALLAVSLLMRSSDD